jgi:hypothetical protein
MDWQSTIAGEPRTCNECGANRMEKSEPDPEKYYIHPDSLPPLETKLGDIVKVVGDGTIKPQSPPSLHWTGLVVPESSFLQDRKLPEDVVVIDETPNAELGTARRKGFGQIMQRDGKPFFWPESEKESDASRIP